MAVSAYLFILEISAIIYFVVLDFIMPYEGTVNKYIFSTVVDIYFLIIDL